MMKLLFCVAICVFSFCSYPSHFSQFSEHDNYSWVVLPQHSPEVLCSLGQRTLGSDVAFLLPTNTQTHYEAPQTANGVRLQARGETVKICVDNRSKGWIIRSSSASVPFTGSKVSVEQEDKQSNDRSDRTWQVRAPWWKPIQSIHSSSRRKGTRGSGQISVTYLYPSM